MPSEVPRERLRDIVTNIDRVRARALGVSIVTEADDLPALRDSIRDAVRCHFDGPDVPWAIRLHVVRDKVISA